MRWSWPSGFRWFVLGGALFLSGCVNAGSELELTTFDRAQDQGKIAEFYGQEAARLRYMARDLSDRTTVYEHLFGPDSDWVKGARLLAQSYLDAARDHEVKAERHYQLSHDPPSPQVR
jgi:hypothetical protein